MARRQVIVIAALALGGIAASVGVAWGCCLWSSLTASRPLAEAEVRPILERRAGAIEFQLPPGGNAAGGRGWEFVFAVDEGTPVPPGAPTAPPAGPPDVTFDQVPVNPDHTVVLVVRAGWPLACLEGYCVMAADGARRHALVDPPVLLAALGLEPKPRRLIPLHPRWGGLAADSLLYATVIWLAVPGPAVLRRLVRRRLGRCPGCGYDVGHARHGACPECGGGA